MADDRQQARQTASDLGVQAARLESANHWEEALPLRVKAAAILTDTFGAGSESTDTARAALANLLTTMGRYAESRAVWEICLAARRKALTDNHCLVAVTWLRIGETYQHEGKFADATKAHAEAAHIVTALPDTIPGIFELRAAAENNQGLALEASSDLLGAEQHFVKALGLMNGVTNNPHLLGAILNGLGETRVSLGRLAEAEADLVRAQPLFSDVPPLAAQRLILDAHLATLYKEQGRAKQAIEIYQRIIPALAAQRGPDDLEVIILKSQLEVCLAVAQQHSAALNLIDDCLNRLTNSHHTDHPLFTTLQLHRADRLADLGDPTAARTAYESLLKAQPDVTNNAIAWTTRERLALVARDQGDLSYARELLQQVLAYRKAHAPESPARRQELIGSMLEWVRFQRMVGCRNQVDEQLGEVRELVQQNQLGNHPLAAGMWTEAGFLAQAMGQTERALSCHQLSLKIRQQSLGENAVPTVQSQLNVADSLERLGKSDEVLPLVQQAHAVATNIVPAGSPLVLTTEFYLGTLLHRAGRLDEAAEHYQIALRAMQQNQIVHAAVVARDFAFLELERGNREKAAQLASEASETQLQFWQNILRFSSEDERLGWQGANDVFSALASVADSDCRPLALAVLRFKGAVLDSLIEDKQLLARTNDSSIAAQIQELQTARRERYRLEMARLGSSGNSSTAVREAIDRASRLESDLAGKVAAVQITRRISSVTLDAVQHTLPADTALLEFVRYEHWLGKGKTEPRYGALMITKTGVPQWRVLGPAGSNQPIATAIADWQSNMHQDAPSTGSNAVAMLKTLYELIWTPIAPMLPSSIHTVIVAPDGDLNFVSFATLWRDNHFLGEDLGFRYVASGRDLLAPTYQPPAKKIACILAAPEYQRSFWRRRLTDPVKESLATFIQLAASRGSWGDEVLPLYSDLPFTHAEAERISYQVRGVGLEAMPVLEGQEATEKAIRALSSPYVLHLATHASFLSDKCVDSESRLLPDKQRIVMPRHPMHRGWLALARANETLDAWRHDAVPDPWNDGLLSAEETSLLHLNGTWLVTLSACDTGLGVGRTGEGVFGLRRGFMMAGARHVLMSLWPVQDERTVQIMEEFYQGALKSGDAPGELARVQARLLKAWRTDKGTGPGRAACYAGTFVLYSAGL